MTYPPVIQFETRALEAEAHARLARERRAGRPEKCTSDRWRLVKWLPLPRPAVKTPAVGIPRRSPATPVPTRTQCTRA
jgi:hypothetical protein